MRIALPGVYFLGANNNNNTITTTRYTAKALLAAFYLICIFKLAIEQRRQAQRDITFFFINDDGLRRESDNWER